jgi:hypothetical protein
VGKRFDFFDEKGRENVFVVQEPLRYLVVHGTRVVGDKDVTCAVGVEVLNGEPDSRAVGIEPGLQLLYNDKTVESWSDKYRFVGKRRIGIPNGNVLEDNI